MTVESRATVQPQRCENVADLRAQVGRDVYLSDWVLVDQARIDRFAEATGDYQWIHVDPARAAAESPFGGTIAHGFLTLSLLGKFYEDFLPALLPFCDVGVNYGLNKVRFTQPVRAGSRVRGRFRLAQVEEIAAGVQMNFTAAMEIEGGARPACVAESIVRRHVRAGEGARA
jgi:acyl dehydratase